MPHLSAEQKAGCASGEGKACALDDIHWESLTKEESFEVLETLCNITSFASHVANGVSSASRAGSSFTGKGKGRLSDQDPVQQSSATAQHQLATVLAFVSNRLRSAEVRDCPIVGVMQTLCRLLDEEQRLVAEEISARECVVCGVSKDLLHFPPGVATLRDRDYPLACTECLEACEVEPARMRDCVVCGDSKDPLDFPATPTTSKCQHPPQACTECLQVWMASQFDTKGIPGINCPECPAELDYSDVKQAASAETFEAYDKLSTRNALASLPDFAWCLSPKCISGQLNFESQNYMDCMSCGYKQCLKHKTAWHWDETCKQYDYRTSGKQARDEEQLTEAMLDKVSKRCPGKGCGWRIQKIDGCDHMTCKRCRFEFCWQCLSLIHI